MDMILHLDYLFRLLLIKLVLKCIINRNSYLYSMRLRIRTGLSYLLIISFKKLQISLTYTRMKKLNYLFCTIKFQCIILYLVCIKTRNRTSTNIVSRFALILVHFAEFSILPDLINILYVLSSARK